MKAIVKQLDGIALAGRAESRHWVVMDTEEKFGGREAASTPLELVLLGLGGCTAMDVISVLKKMHVNFSDVEIGLDGERADDHPRKFTKIRIEYRIFGRDIDPDKVEKAIQLTTEKYCAVVAMLNSSVELSYSYKINP